MIRCTDGVSWISASVHGSPAVSATAGPAGACAAGDALALGSSPGSAAVGDAPITGCSSDGVVVGVGLGEVAPLARLVAPEPLDPPHEYTTSRMSSRSPPATRARRRQ